MIEIITPEVEVYDIKKLLESLPIDNNRSASSSERLSEFIGRVCYNSYDKMTPTSFIDFNKKAANDAHRSIFEFNNIQLTLSLIGYKQLSFTESFFSSCKYLKYNILSNDVYNAEDCYIMNVYGSVRSFIEAIEKIICGNMKENYPVWLFTAIYNMLIFNHPTIFINWATYPELTNYNNILKKGISSPATWSSDITHLTALKNDIYKKILVRIVSDKGVHNEFVRHRPMSIMAESQRYVRFGIGANAKNPMRVCIAAQHATDTTYVNALRESSQLSFDTYINLLNLKYPPQQARAALPVGTAMTYFLYGDREEFNHFFSLRTAKAALPMAQEISKEMRDQMVNKHLI